MDVISLAMVGWFCASQADASMDEVYAQLSLLPENEVRACWHARALSLDADNGGSVQFVSLSMAAFC